MKLSKLCIPLLFVTVAIAGCAPKATKLSSGNTPDTQLIECNGLIYSFSDCVKKAQEICPNGYDVLTANKNDKTAMTLGFDGKAGISEGGTDRTMLVKCK